MVLSSILLLADTASPSAKIGEQALTVAISVAVSQLIIGILIFVAWYAVSKRVISHEFPGVIERFTGELAQLRSSMSADFQSIRQDIASLRAENTAQQIAVARHETSLGYQQERIQSLERDRENRWNREHGLDDTRGR